MRPHRVVFHTPPLRQNLCLLQRVKDLAIQELIAQLSIEALTIPVLPGTPRLDVQRPRAHSPQPLPQLLGDELRPVDEGEDRLQKSAGNLASSDSRGTRFEMR